MSGHDDLTHHSEQQRTSRRSLVRAAATSAWAVPLISVAAAAPANAAASASKTLSILVSSFYWTTVTDSQLGLSDAPTVVPFITVHNNATTPATFPQIGIAFPANFVGPGGSLEPVEVGGLGLGSGWFYYVQTGHNTELIATAYGYSATIPAQGSITIGGPQPSDGTPTSEPGFGLAWQSQVVGAVTVLAAATGYTTVTAPLVLDQSSG